MLGLAAIRAERASFRGAILAIHWKQRGHMKGEFMKKLLGTTLAILFGATLAFGAEQTLKGKSSDSMCGASHKSAIEHAGKRLTDRECVQACIKDGGKYVFASAGKVYNIDNQDFADLAVHA